ncbi:carbohydrate binding domain-containing protein [Streptosporangium canum]|uniref:carbohydrate binding domain-containing protein n=1 Tax=Streptosporangium canum TaxID=324952 RepID=UPI0033BD3E8C
MRRTLLTVLAAVTAAGLLQAPAHADDTAHYVDCSAATNGTGTVASPWNNLATVSATTFGPGDTILFKRGTVCTGQLYPKGSGAPGKPIVADAYGTGAQPEIAGAGQVKDAVYLYNQEYWELRNLAVTNKAATAALRGGVRIMAKDFGTLDYIRLTNLTVHDVKGDNTKLSVGISMEVEGTTTPTKFNDVILDGNEVHTVDRTGISNSTTWSCKPSMGCTDAAKPAYTPWTNVVWRNNTIHDIGGDGMIMRYLDRGIAEHNVAYDINMRSGQNNAGIWTIASNDNIIQYNEAYRVRRPAGTADGNAWDADFGDDRAVIQYNYSHDNEGGMVLLCGKCGSGTSSTGTIVRYNVSQNDGSRIVYAVGQTNAKFYNNTIYLPAGSTTKIIEQDKATTIEFKNNIFVNLGTGGYTYTAADYTFLGNTFYGYHPANEPADAAKLTSDPLFTAPGTGPSGYRLRVGSPARASGVLVADNGGKDFAGAPVPSVCAPDRGAFQASAFSDAACSPVLNGGFEFGTLTPWTKWNSATVTSSPVHSGGNALTLGAAPSSVEQIITVKPSTTYTLSGWAKVSAAGNQVAIGVKNYGGNQASGNITAVTWTKAAVNFTTGATSTKATVFCYKNVGSGSANCDDIDVSILP